MRQEVPLDHAYRLLNHGPVTLVSSAAGGRRNVMAAAWVMPVDFVPAKIAVVIDRNTLTRELIDASGEFALNLPPRHLVDATVAVGSRSGREGDKFAALGLGTFAAAQIAAPLLSDCIGWLECRVIAEPGIAERHDLIVASVLSAQADARVFSHGRWHFDDPGLRTLHHVAGGYFFATGDGFQAGA